MRVQIYTPRPAEAKVEYSSKESLLSISPIFTRRNGTNEVGFIEINNASGHSRKYLLQVNGSTGRLQCREYKPVEADFDKIGAGA
jgi:hypothetical protein